MKHWMFRCKDVSQRISESFDRKLPFHHRMMIRLHLMMCRFCSRFQEQLVMLRTLSQITELPGEGQNQAFALPAQARMRIKDALKSSLQ
ncbi:MAG: zf-HC2 domain-containing protein [Deltaproteobacteria bacterium]|nr:zf-HC2 domain-containing protein [Deltaproteobacteria bacterium]MBW1962368.1 zf-HC2 domain-containing protein [Deltaproteobacteria bacterium]MBW1994200.1 zf-HC2 domain-containing protein [Deltaproteobacteria bacterium]MBW2150787.1 zf-HC2 domain-containing protein [Deltaproteobacteria bacterium]